MGDRATVFFVDSAQRIVSPSIYLHWHGHDVLSILEEAMPLMCRSDPDASAARFVGVAHTRMPDSGLSLYVHAVACDYDTIINEFQGPGDAGTFFVDVDTGALTWKDGYGLLDAEGRKVASAWLEDLWDWHKGSPLDSDPRPVLRKTYVEDDP